MMTDEQFDKVIQEWKGRIRSLKNRHPDLFPGRAKSMTEIMKMNDEDFREMLEERETFRRHQVWYQNEAKRIRDSLPFTFDSKPSVRMSMRTARVRDAYELMTSGLLIHEDFE